MSIKGLWHNELGRVAVLGVVACGPVALLPPCMIHSLVADAQWCPIAIPPRFDPCEAHRMATVPARTDLLSEIDAKQDQVLAELDALEAQLQKLLNEYAPRAEAPRLHAEKK